VREVRALRATRSRAGNVARPNRSAKPARQSSTLPSGTVSGGRTERKFGVQLSRQPFGFIG
jgi:hypothetical protein